MESHNVVPLFLSTAFGIVLNIRVSISPFECSAVLHVAPFVDSVSAESWLAGLGEELKKFHTGLEEDNIPGYQIELLKHSVVKGSEANNWQIEWESALDPGQKSIRKVLKEVPSLIAESAAEGIKELYSDI